MKEEEKYKITIEGSLGLLALGAVGVTSWRKVRDQEYPEKPKNDES